jgi:hypothetical protein
VPKVFGLHEIELSPSVTPEEYEQFRQRARVRAGIAGLENLSPQG